MAFHVDDIVKKIGGNQKYKVVEVLADSRYKCKLEPPISSIMTLVFKESELELA